MVLDTRWKRFKYSNASKLLCVILALVMSAVFVINGVSLLRCYAFFNDEDFLVREDRSFYSSRIFSYNINMDISTIVGQVSYNSELKKYEEAEARYIESALAHYRAEQAKNILTDENISEYIAKLSNSYNYDFSKEPYMDGYNVSYYLNIHYGIYKGDDGKWYRNDFDFETLSTSKYSSENMNFGHTDERAREMLKKYFYNSHLNEYVSYDGYYDRNLGKLVNISYYAENDDGTVFTSVENGEAFVNSIKNGEVDYIAFENGKLLLSEKLEIMRDSIWTTGKSDCRIYVSVNTAFDGEDRYGAWFNEYNKVSGVEVKNTAIVMGISLLAMIALMVVSVRLAGHTENGNSIALIDKFPHDLHLVATGVLVYFAVAAIFLLLPEYESIVPYDYYKYSIELASLASSLYTAALMALVGGIYLLILEFATSVARSVKAERPIIRKTAIFMLLAGIFKLLKLCFRNGGKGVIAVFKFIFVTVIGGFFRLIGKGIRKVLHLCKLLALKPKRLEKKLVSATVWYTLFNFAYVLAIILITAYYCNVYYYDLGTLFIDVIALAGLIAIDYYAVSKAVSYLKALDDIIDTSAKREPLPYDTAMLPPSLKTLAESLEATNAELNEAVLKAVKDERTKAELITNVSHDLKTPLTSVINYIDLLQKCDIEDETAKQYMAVIDEKSGKLKRLIEDLIEASKVSTGNVTLNKTKLNLNELASQAIVEETSDIEKNNLQILFDESGEKHIVFADGTKIYRVFENLLSNARKYSAPYSRIYARVYSDKDFGYFEIKNISKDPLNISAEELTERFVRGDKSRSQEGNGLGLSIARELCKLNGGDLIITIDGDLFKATVRIPKEENQEFTKD